MTMFVRGTMRLQVDWMCWQRPTRFGVRKLELHLYKHEMHRVWHIIQTEWHHPSVLAKPSQFIFHFANLHIQNGREMLWINAREIMQCAIPIAIYFLEYAEQLMDAVVKSETTAWEQTYKQKAKENEGGERER